MMVEKNVIAICPMTEADLDAVLAIEADSFHQPWTKEHFLHEIGATHSFPLVAIAPDDIIAGYICPMLVIDEGHILDVAVSLAYRGLGIGRLLVERVLRDCRDAGADFVSLEVRPSNAGALALYGALGFVETGRRKRYYHDGEDAVLMEYIFSTSEE
jgi:[ribosomal protein S18]-alanine N-acetyltransferase